MEAVADDGGNVAFAAAEGLNAHGAENAEAFFLHPAEGSTGLGYIVTVQPSAKGIEQHGSLPHERAHLVKPLAHVGGDGFVGAAIKADMAPGVAAKGPAGAFELGDDGFYRLDLCGAEGGALLPGTMIGNLKLLFPKIRISGGMDEGEALRKLKYASPDAALTLLPAELSAGSLSECAEEALSALRTFEGRGQELTALRTALRHRTVSEDLPKDLARRLYRGPRSVSITRLEKYAECPFRHFIEYGLRPKKIEPFELRKQDEGTFYHEAMERFLGEEWPEMNGLNIEEAMARMDDITERLLAPMMDGPLGQNPVTLSHSRRMREVARRAARTAAKHLSDSRFEPCALEVQFGEEDPAIVLHTGSGDLPLQGRIDRIDRWSAGDQAWLRIIDYKSGMSELNLTKLYFGLQLQLIIYLAVALERGACRPAGAFYFKVIDPMIATEERDADKVDLERTKELRLSGLFINNREVLDAMSPDIEQTVQLTLKSDGTVKQSTRMMDENGFKLLITHAVNAATRIAEGIRQGKTEIAPVAFGSASSCEYCDWRALCQKDPRLGGMPKTLPSIQQSDVLDEILAERMAGEGEI